MQRRRSNGSSAAAYVSAGDTKARETRQRRFLWPLLLARFNATDSRESEGEGGTNRAPDSDIGSQFGEILRAEVSDERRNPEKRKRGREEMENAMAMERRGKEMRERVRSGVFSLIRI